MLKAVCALVLAFATAAAFAVVDANKATQAELESVKGIGPAVSQRILDERRKREFSDWADFIARVKGVGEAGAKRYSDGGLVVNGAAYDPSPPRRQPKNAATSALRDTVSLKPRLTSSLVKSDSNSR